MDNFIQNERTIIVDGKVTLEDCKLYWRDKYAGSLPNAIIFWGTLAIGSLFLALVFRGDELGFFFFLFTGFIVLVPIFISFYSYYSYLAATKKYIASLSESEKYFNMMITPGGRGIEYMQGENYTFISWDSIGGAVEKEKYFSLDFKTNPVLIMKNEFNDPSDIVFFRNFLADRFGKKAKLLR